METNRYVVGLGEALWDVLPEGKKLGGAPANFAYHAGQLLGRDRTVAISALGADALGDEIVRHLEARGLRHVMPRVPYPTGTVQVQLDAHGVPAYDIRRDVAWDHIPLDDRIRTIARTCRAVCFGSLAQRSAASRATIHGFLDLTPADCLKVFDINLRQEFYSREVVEESMRRCDVLKINDEELAVVGRLFGLPEAEAEPTCRRLVEGYGLRLLVLTCGTAGSYVFASDGQTSFLPTPRVEVADTVGAGDSFTGAFCAAILAGRPVPEAHRRAVEVSAYVCSQHGAMPTLPDALASL